MTKEQLENKLKRIVKWIFSDIVINLRSNNEIWKDYNLGHIKVYKWGFEIGESNIGVIQLICAAIEVFGRIFKGKRSERDVSRECFTTFIKNFFPKEYHQFADEIYTKYRCGLLHSHILDYKNSFYPNRYNRDPRAKHLMFADKNLNEFVNNPDENHPRMVLDIDRFFYDFKHAVETFCDTVLREKINITNVEKSLKEL